MKKQYYPFITALSLALIIALLIPVNAIADDVTPPPPTEEPVAPPTEPVVPPTGDTETPVSDDSSIVESPTAEVLDEPPSSTEPAATESTGDTLPGESVMELLEELPGETSVIVQVEGGIEPLVTQAAEAAVIVGDPIWCPDGVPPIINTGGCTDSYATLLELIDDVGVNFFPVDDGTIWITGGVDNSNADIEIDGTVSAAFLAWSDFQLTIQGGWDGTTNLNNISGSSLFSYPIIISNWQNTITVNNISIDTSATTNSTGLFVQTTGGDIELADVASVNNGGVTSNGVELEANFALTGGNVTISGDNDFSGNGGAGLLISADGDVTLSDIVANQNGDVGISINAGGDIDAENLEASTNGVEGAILVAGGSAVILGANIFEDNAATGLDVEAVGDIELENVDANLNGTGGVGSGVNLTSTAGSISLIGTNTFDGNEESGIVADAFGDIDTENLNASQNIGDGASLTAGGSVSVLGNNIFEDNGGLGLTVDADGDIDTENLFADGNGVELTAGGGIVMTGNNEFNNNTGGNGLTADAGGGIDAENISAAGNSGTGADLQAQLDILISGVNVFDQNTDSGLYAATFGLGNIEAENLTATGNGGIGVEFNTASGNVLVTGSNIFDDNQDTGLFIEASGDILAENLAASINSADGVYLASLLGNVQVTGSNVFADNDGYGLLIESAGTINAENISATGNGNSGAEFNALGAVTLTGTNEFSSNIFDGLLVYAGDDIYIENTDALNNGGVGVYVDTPGDVKVVCSVMSGNAGYELEADMGGYLTLIGTDFGDSIDDDLGADEDFLILVSNGCFTYSFPTDDDDEEDDDNNAGGDQVFGNVVVPPLPIANKTGVDRQVIGLECATFSGTILTLSNGDSVYIPCPIIDSARLAEIPEQALASGLPNDEEFVSAFILDIYLNGQLVGFGNEAGLIDFSNISTSSGGNNGYVYVYWNGFEWVEVTDQTFPFMGLYFVVPKDMMNADLAILYWDGSNWVELTDGAQFGQGREVGQGGEFVYFEDQLHFAATVNFTGTFVLVKK